MAKLPWFKLYCEIIHDPKIRRLSPDERWLWIVLLSLAASNEKRGVISVTRTSSYSCDELSELCGYTFRDMVNGEIDPREMVKNALDTFEKLEMIERDSNGVIFIKNFEKRQDSYLSDAERSSRYRKNANVTTVTLEEKEKENKIKIKKENKRVIGTSAKPSAPKDPSLDFIEGLKNNPAYKSIDIERELAKMDAWLQTPKGKRRQKTKGFVLSWLNRIDQPMKAENGMEAFRREAEEEARGQSGISTSR